MIRITFILLLTFLSVGCGDGTELGAIDETSHDQFAGSLEEGVVYVEPEFQPSYNYILVPPDEDYGNGSGQVPENEPQPEHEPEPDPVDDYRRIEINPADLLDPWGYYNENY